VNRTYTGIVSNQTGQNYDTLVFGDTASGFVERVDGPSQSAAGDGTSASEVAPTVVAVALPEVAVDRSMSNFIAAVKTSAIDANNNWLDSRVISLLTKEWSPFKASRCKKPGSPKALGMCRGTFFREQDRSGRYAYRPTRLTSRH